jgi:carotenoid cleavage dioxygenase
MSSTLASRNHRQDIVANPPFQWFYGDTAYLGHIANSWEEDGKLHLYIAHAEGNVFAFFPDKDGHAPPPTDCPNRLVKFVIDPASEDLYVGKPEVIISNDNEFVRIDDRFMGYKSRYVFGAITDNSKGGTDWGLVVQRIGGTSDPFLHFTLPALLLLI